MKNTVRPIIIASLTTIFVMALAFAPKFMSTDDPQSTVRFEQTSEELPLETTTTTVPETTTTTVVETTTTTEPQVTTTTMAPTTTTTTAPPVQPDVRFYWEGMVNGTWNVVMSNVKAAEGEFPSLWAKVTINTVNGPQVFDAVRNGPKLEVSIDPTLMPSTPDTGKGVPFYVPVHYLSVEFGL